MARASAEARRRLHLPRRAPRSRHRGAPLVDYPTFAQGDELVIKPGTRILGVDDIDGTVTITELSPTAVRISIAGSMGPVSQELRVELRALNDTHANFELGGFGFDEPFLVRIRAARTGYLEVQPEGSDDPVVVRTTDDGDLRLEFRLGGEQSIILAGR